MCASAQKRTTLRLAGGECGAWGLHEAVGTPTFPTVLCEIPGAPPPLPRPLRHPQLSRSSSDLYYPRFGGFGLLERVQRTPAAVRVWEARATAHNAPGVPVRLRYNASLEGQGWFVLDVAPQCSTTNLGFIGRDLASEGVRVEGVLGEGGRRGRASATMGCPAWLVGGRHHVAINSSPYVCTGSAPRVCSEFAPPCGVPCPFRTTSPR